MSINFKIIGSSVKESRLEKRMSQAVLAELTDMSTSYICYIETAKKHASLDSLVRIANVLGVTVDHLLNGNQINDQEDYREDMVQFIEGCTIYEKRIIYDIAIAAIMSLRDNEYLQEK